VIRALAEADRPLRAREIHEAAQELAGTPLSWNTVKDCLHKSPRRPGGTSQPWQISASETGSGLSTR
jgi:hypothetical protein